MCFLAGAGQDVGRSCILVSIGGKNIMLDCGMHMGYNDDVHFNSSCYIHIVCILSILLLSTSPLPFCVSFQRRFPDFSYITQNGRLTEFLDCVIIRLVYT